MAAEENGGASCLDEATRLAAEALARRAGITLNDWVRQKADEEAGQEEANALALEELAFRVTAIERLVRLQGQHLADVVTGPSASKRRRELLADSLNPDFIAAAAAAGAEPGRRLRSAAAYAVLANLAKSAADLFDGPVAALEYLEARRIVEGRGSLQLICEGRAVEVVAYLARRRARRTR